MSSSNFERHKSHTRRIINLVLKPCFQGVPIFFFRLMKTKNRVSVEDICSINALPLVIDQKDKVPICVCQKTLIK